MSLPVSQCGDLKVTIVTRTIIIVVMMMIRVIVHLVVVKVCDDAHGECDDGLDVR